MNTRLAAVLFLAMSAFAACGSGGGGGGGGSLPVAVAGGGSQNPPIVPATSTPTAAPTGTPTGTPPTATAAPTSTPTAGVTPTPIGGATPTPGASSTPVPVPTPTPTGYFAQGNVRDFDTAAAIGGATVVIAPPVYAGSTPPPGVTTSATTAPDGSFTVTSLTPGSNYIEVFYSGYATLHKILNITSFNNQVGTQKITRLTADQTNWLQQVNADRAAWSASPVVFDEILVEGARHWADYMANNGWYQPGCPSSDPSCQTALQYEQSQGGTYTSTGSNIDAEPPPSTWQNAETKFMSESSKCPQPVVPSKCPSTAAPEFLNIINPSFIWVGLAEHPGGKSYSLVYPFLDYYDQEFGTPLH